MDTLRTIYTIKGRNIQIFWEFHYDLEGYLTDFKIEEGRLNETQIKWLFNPSRFPYRESAINTWKAIKNFEITIGKPATYLNQRYWEDSYGSI